MYIRYADRMGWKHEVLGADPSTRAASTRSPSSSGATACGAT